jgi:uncharacterized membrane protein
MEYSYLKLLHLIAVIIFLGNIFTGLFWMRIAVKTRDLKIISHSINGVIRSDKLFTIPGVIFITAFGIITAINGHIALLHTGWILWSIILFSISGIVFTVKVAPLQKKILHLTLNQETSNDFNWMNFKKEYLKWEIWGSIALLTPVGALFMMILKIPQ